MANTPNLIQQPSPDETQQSPPDEKQPLQDDTQPPPDFLLIGSPNDGENGSYTCPFEGCDGIVCGSAQECHAHINAWHRGPYRCHECDANFAAQPALKRHERDAGHLERWVCARQGCEMEGVEFASHLGYRDHVIVSDSHPGFGRTPTRESCKVEGDDERYKDDDDGAKEEGNDDDGDVEGDGSDDSLSAVSSTKDRGHLCLEPCCNRHLENFTETTFRLHLKTHAHTAATRAGAALEKQGLSATELVRRQEALRTFRCDEPRCKRFKRLFCSSQSYYRHVQTWEHLYPVKDEDDNDSGNRDEWEEDEYDDTAAAIAAAAAAANGVKTEVKSSRGGSADEKDFWLASPRPPPRRRCAAEGCARYGQYFSNESNYERHVRSVQHVAATGAVAFGGRARGQQALPSPMMTPRRSRRTITVRDPRTSGFDGAIARNDGAIQFVEDEDEEMGDGQDQGLDILSSMASNPPELQTPDSAIFTNATMPPPPPPPPPITPTPTFILQPRHPRAFGRGRVLFLERRNRALEEEVRGLRAQVAWLSGFVNGWDGLG